MFIVKCSGCLRDQHRDIKIMQNCAFERQLSTTSEPGPEMSRTISPPPTHPFRGANVREVLQEGSEYLIQLLTERLDTINQDALARYDGFCQRRNKTAAV